MTDSIEKLIEGLYNPDQVEKALMNLSEACSIFEQLVMSNPRVNKEFVDIVAQLNRRQDHLEKMNDKLKGFIKTDLMSHEETIRQGNEHEAVLTSMQKSYWITDKLKAFLNEHLPEFREVRLEQSLKFRART